MINGRSTSDFFKKKLSLPILEPFASESEERDQSQGPKLAEGAQDQSFLHGSGWRRFQRRRSGAAEGLRNWEVETEYSSDGIQG